MFPFDSPEGLFKSLGKLTIDTAVTGVKPAAVNDDTETSNLSAAVNVNNTNSNTNTTNSNSNSNSDQLLDKGSRLVTGKENLKFSTFQDSIWCSFEQCLGSSDAPSSSTVTTVTSSNNSASSTSTSLLPATAATIVVSGLPDDFKERELRNMLLFARGFESCHLRSSGCGISPSLEEGGLCGVVKFASTEDAERAIKILDGHLIDPRRGLALKAMFISASDFGIGSNCSGSGFSDTASTTATTSNFFSRPSATTDATSSTAASRPSRSMTISVPGLKEPEVVEEPVPTAAADLAAPIPIPTPAVSGSLSVSGSNRSCSGSSCGSHGGLASAAAASASGPLMNSDNMMMPDKHPSQHRQSQSHPQGGYYYNNSSGRSSSTAAAAAAHLSHSHSQLQPQPQQLSSYSHYQSLLQQPQNQSQPATAAPQSIPPPPPSPIVKQQSLPLSELVNFQKGLIAAGQLGSLAAVVGENFPCNTLYVGNLPPNAEEDELRMLFKHCFGYRRLSFKPKATGPMCFVEFEDIACATAALETLYGTMLSCSNPAKGGIRLSYSKNPLGLRVASPVCDVSVLGNVHAVSSLIKLNDNSNVVSSSNTNNNNSSGSNGAIGGLTSGSSPKPAVAAAAASPPSLLSPYQFYTPSRSPGMTLSPLMEIPEHRTAISNIMSHYHKQR